MCKLNHLSDMYFHLMNLGGTMSLNCTCVQLNNKINQFEAILK